MATTLLMRKRILTAKIETAYGVDSTPTGANAVLIRNLEVTPVNVEYVSRELIRPYFGNFDDIPVATSINCSFQVEMAGSGVAGTAPAYGQLLRACALSQTISMGVSTKYTPVSSGFESLSLRINVDGVEHTILGARGSVSMDLSVKDIPVYNFTFTGLYGGETDAAPVTPIYNGYITPEGVNSINTGMFSIHGFTGLLQSMSVDLANSVVFRTLVGEESVRITDRKVAGSVVIQAPLTAEKDFFEIAKEGTLGAVTVTHGLTAGNRVRLTMPNVQLKSPTYQDSDGIVMLSMEMMILPSQVGNDELEILVS